jgi:hypothetical protein
VGVFAECEPDPVERPKTLQAVEAIGRRSLKERDVAELDHPLESHQRERGRAVDVERFNLLGAVDCRRPLLGSANFQLRHQVAGWPSTNSKSIWLKTLGG